MVTLTNLRLPISFQTGLAQNSNFNISRNQLDDFLEALGDIDWGTTNFLNVGTINGTAVSAFWTDLVNGVLGDLQDIDANASLGNQQGDLLYFDGVAWNKFQRGVNGQFLKSTTTGIAWGGGSAQVNDYNDNLFTVHLNTDYNKAFQFDAQLITTTLPTVRQYILPDANGTIALLSDIPTISGTFVDDDFTLTDAIPNDDRKAKFQCAGITNGFTRTFTFPNQSGVLALITDIPPAGNAFADDVFHIYDDVTGDITLPKRLRFELDQMTADKTVTLRPLTTDDKTYDIPDANDFDEFVFRDFTQTLMNKTLDATNLVDDGALSANVVLNNQVNTFGLGFRQTFTADLAGSAGLQLFPIAGNPTSFLDGDMWVNSTLGKAYVRIGGVSVDFSSAQAVDTSFVITCSDEGTDLDTLNNPKTTFRMPFGYVLSSVRASVRVAPVGSTIIVDIKQNNLTILSTLITIDSGEFSSFTASIPPVISTSTLTNDAEIEISLTQVGSTTPGKGLKVYFIGQHV